MKTERLKKLEAELRDLRQWLKLGLVPKNDVAKHEEEIVNLESRIHEEQDRIQYLKETGDLEEYYATRRVTPQRGGYPEGSNMSEMDLNDTDHAVANNNDTAADVETEAVEVENSVVEDNEDEATATQETDSDDLFTDRRWRRGIIDPDANDW